MNAIQATRESVGLARDYLEAAIGDCEPETLARTLPGATIGSILSIYAHALQSEDWVIQQLAQKKDQIIITSGWYERFGIEPPAQGKEPDWTAINVPLADVQQYAKAVYAATDAWLASATDADLDMEIPWHSGPKTLGWVFADAIHVHLSFHSGEIASLKGVMGLKGLPW